MGGGLNKQQQSQAFYWSLIILDVITFLLNFLTCAMFLRFRKHLLITTHNRILFSMALADALVGVFGTSFGILLLLKQPALYYKLAGNIPMFSSLFVSVLCLALLTADRLVAVKRPFSYTSPAYRRFINKLLFASWVLPAFITIQQSLIFVYLSKKEELVVRSVLFAAFFLMASVALVVSNIALIAIIRNHFTRVNFRQSGIQPQASVVSQSAYQVEEHDATADCPDFDMKVELSTIAERKPHKAGRASKKRKMTHKNDRRSDLRQTSLFCVIIVSLFLILWMPLAGYRISYAFGVSLNISWLRRLALCLSIVNSLFNPIIYFLAKKDLRKYMMRLFAFT